MASDSKTGAVISPDELHAILTSESAKNVLVLDVRPEMFFSKMRLSCAVHVSLRKPDPIVPPSSAAKTMDAKSQSGMSKDAGKGAAKSRTPTTTTSASAVRDAAFEVASLPLTIADADGARQFQRRGEFANVVVYDSSSSAADGEGPACVLVRALAAEGVVRRPLLLVGGFGAHSARFPGDCVRGTSASSAVAVFDPSPLLGATAEPISEVIPGKLFLGTKRDAASRTDVARLGITHVLNVTEEVPDFQPIHLSYMRVPVADDENEDIAAHFERAFRFIDMVCHPSSKDRLLVHCYLGKSRAVTIVLAYLMHKRRWTLREAIYFLRTKRSTVAPNPGFMRQLIAFDVSRFGKASVTVDDVKSTAKPQKEKDQKEQKEPSEQQRVALVTGANRGIGFHIVERLCGVTAPGCSPAPPCNMRVLLAARCKADAEAAVAALNKQGVQSVEALELDVCDDKSVAAAAELVRRRFGGLDVLVNNAGVLAEDDAERTVRVNFFGALSVCGRFLPLLRPNARVVNVSSVRGAWGLRDMSESLRARLLADGLTTEQLSALMNEFVADAKAGKLKERGWCTSAYNASKAGLTMLTRVLARDCNVPGVVFSSVNPGWCRTRMAPHAPMTPEQGAVAPVFCAMLPAGSPSGRYWEEDLKEHPFVAT